MNSRKILPINSGDLTKRYLSGTSEKQLADEFDVSRCVIRLRLLESGIQPRGRAEAERLKWSLRKLRPNYRGIVKRQCSDAWKAATGRKKSFTEKVKFAESMAGKGRGKGEFFVGDLHDALVARDISVSWQHPIGCYNVDLALDELPIAVEIQRPGLKTAKVMARTGHSTMQERLEYILDRGWSVLYIWCPPGYKYRGKEPIPGTRYERFDVDAVADQTVAFLQATRGNPSTCGQYGMIGGHGQQVESISNLNFDHRPRVRGF